MKLNNQMEKSNLISNVFNPMEAKNMITSIIDKNINQCKIEYMMNWEHNHNANLDHIDKKIAELKEKKENFEKIIEEANHEGYNICLDETIELKLMKAV